MTQKGGGFSGTALGHRPQYRAKGADPRTGTPLRRNVFLPWCPVSSLSWPACAGALLVPGRWFSGPAPSGSCLFWFRLMFLSIGRGRRVPAPSWRDDVGSSAGAPTQEPAQGADPRTAFYRYPSAYGFVVYLVAPSLFFPLHFAILLWRSWHCFPCMLELFGKLNSGSASFSTTWSSNGSFTQTASSYHPVVFLPLPVVPNHTASVPVFTSQARRFFPRSMIATQLLREFFGKRESFCGYGEVCALAECVPFCATEACFEETGHFDTELDPSSLLAPNASIAKKCCTDRLAQRA